MVPRRRIRGIRDPLRSGTLVGRLSAGLGHPEEVNAADVLDFIEFGNAFNDTNTIDFTFNSVTLKYTADYIGELADNADVVISSPSDGEHLEYQASDDTWRNAASGGGGTGNPENFLRDRLRQNAATKSGSANASKGLEFSPLVNFDVHRASAWFAPVASANYTASIAQIGSSGATSISAAPVFSSTLVASSDTTVRWNQFAFPSSVSVTAGNFYVLLISRADGGDTYVLPIGFAVNNTFPDAAFDLPIVPDTRFVLLPKAVPSNGDTLTRTAGNMPTVGMMIEIT